MIVISGGRLDDLWHFRHHGTVRQFVYRLLHDAPRLSHLLHAYEVAVVGVAVLAQGHVKIKVGVGRIGARLAYVPRDARPAQRRPGQPYGNRVLSRDDADAYGASEPDAILREHRLVLVYALREVVDEAAYVLFEIVVRIIRHASDPPSVAGQARAELPLEDFQNLFALAQRPQEHRHRADVQGVGGEPEQVRSDAVQLGQDGAYVVGARRDGKPHHLLDRLDPDQPVRDRRDVVETIPVRRDHRILAILCDLLHPAMQEAYVAVEINHRLAIEPQDDAQHAMRRRVLRPHVQDHFGAIEQRLSGGRYLYLVHKKQ